MYRVPFARLWVPFPKLGPIEGAEETLTAAPISLGRGMPCAPDPFLKIANRFTELFLLPFFYSACRWSRLFITAATSAGKLCKNSKLCMISVALIPVVNYYS
jgi:hypothetical protein